MADPAGPGETSSRRYDSPVRRARAEETRLRVIAAAGELYTQAGYEGATVAKIAARAGVSVDTVMATGSKAYLLLEAFRVRALGEGGPEALGERSFAQEIFSITDPAAGLEAVVSFMAAAHAGSADLWTLINATALTDPMVAEVLDELKRSRDASYETTVHWLLDLGAIPAVAEHDRPAQMIGCLLALSAEQYLQLTRDWGLDADQYRAWLTRRLRDGHVPGTPA